MKTFFLLAEEGSKPIYFIGTSISWEVLGNYLIIKVIHHTTTCQQCWNIKVILPEKEIFISLNEKKKH